jgi:hypothetical protein
MAISSIQASPTATPCLQKAPSRPTGQVQENSISSSSIQTFTL